MDIRFRQIMILSVAMLFTITSAQAAAYIQFGYAHHDSYYGHHAYGYPFYGLHSYYGHHSYHRHYYGHHYGEYAYPYFSYRESSESDYATRRNDRNGSNIRSTGNGWALLGNNQARAALSDFGRQARASPSKGAPKVGYALASADLGRLDKGVWAMRRALKIDPGALHYVSLDRNMDSKVKQIIRKYEKKQAYSSNHSDSSFMLASLHYLRRDIEAAGNHIDRARDSRTSTRNLKSLIDQERDG